jgi:S1-C subfamily serine protease
LPQDTTPQPVAAPATNVDAPVAQVITPIVVQESLNRSSNGSIPVTKSTVEQVAKNAAETRGWLGLEAHPLTLESASSMNLGSAQRGMIINDVVKGGPADIAGMEIGDLLVTVDNKAVDSGGAIREVVSKIPVGSVVPIKIIRGGREKYLFLTITQVQDLRTNLSGHKSIGKAFTPGVWL